ncbi:MAG: preprotein translocase subunit TatB [Azospira sp.]|jgi:site-specific recombinase|nr:preprotein translocase subunit TatB [Azospira sp.]
MSDDLQMRLCVAIDRHAAGDDPLPLFAALFAVIRPRRAADAEAAAAGYDALLDLLAANASRRAAVQRQLARLLASRRLVGFLADSGILPPTGFFSELTRIASHRVLPELPEDDEMRDALHVVFHRHDDWRWLAAIPADRSLRFWQLLAPHESMTPQERAWLIEQIVEAMLALAYRISAFEFEREFRRLDDQLAGYTQAFRAVAGEAQRFADALRAALARGTPPEEDERQLLVLIDQCETMLARARRAATRFGTSLSLTFSLIRMTQSLHRLAVLAQLMGSHAQVDDPAQRETAAFVRWNELTRAALRAENQRNSLRQHLSRGMSLLALRVTDNAAKTGEHYVTETRPAYWRMWRSAMGAGAIIAVLALLKIFASKLEIALFGHAFIYSMIYGLGFALIYMLHLTIATKQPAMTAQTIAGYLDEARPGRTQDLERIVELIAAVSRSQIAAIAGNVAVALPLAIGLSLLWQHHFGTPMLDIEKGAHLLDDLDPLGWALPHAAIAGVFLFFAGIISGFFDNLAAHSRIGERIARLRWLSRLAGKARAARIGAYVDDHLGGLAGNFLFGCMLGSAGTLGVIFGLPIDIRHIAFSSANFGYALAAFEFALPAATLLWAALGVLLIGAVNLAVSFSLALWMALRARGVEFDQTRELLRLLGRRFIAAPGRFVAAPAV